MMEATPAADHSTRRSEMSGKRSWVAAAFLAAGLAAGTMVNAQSSQPSQAEKPTQSQPNQQSSDPRNSGSSRAVPGAPGNPEELAAVKAFQEMPNTDLQKKIEAGEEFLKKYPESLYRPMVYPALTMDYIQTGNPEKAFEI